ncbi:hypothetical protein F3Y22_tig00116939pilonHSYRG00075 [Hibiscus syriacus]|uniref:Uncharacterized protein n=1 Tax=Hibiscus syriacus TaxID=106335 RepID=A0A6A2WNA8_HIBSY|nr:hypothetical protein F3Y22_tig00116939pilonHSYRG00075 [Hibiscus syriacus]
MTKQGISDPFTAAATAMSTGHPPGEEGSWVSMAVFFFLTNIGLVRDLPASTPNIASQKSHQWRRVLLSPTRTRYGFRQYLHFLKKKTLFFTRCCMKLFEYGD